MKPNQQNIAIARACGWTAELIECKGLNIRTVNWWNPNGKLSTLPSFTTDLNAMHDAESLIIAKGLSTIRLYEDELQKHVANVIFTTAAQRAEAFLRTLNLWKPS